MLEAGYRIQVRNFSCQSLSWCQCAPGKATSIDRLSKEGVGAVVFRRDVHVKGFASRQSKLVDGNGCNRLSVGTDDTPGILNPGCEAGSDPCEGDFNGDGIVNGADFGGLLAAWGLCDGCPEDLNGDGQVSGADIGLLLSVWGLCP